MTESTGADRPGLRERKKAKTRVAIQEHALRLFRERGYDETTVEQIAEAAEISPSTFFRYFPTKEAVVVYDALDPVLIAHWRAQPPEVPPVTAFRRAIVQAFGSLTDKQIDDMRERARLVYGVPELRLAMVNDMIRTGDLMLREAALRTGRSADDFELRIFTGALMGAFTAAVYPAIDDPKADYLELMGRVFDYLEKGMPL